MIVIALLRERSARRWNEENAIHSVRLLAKNFDGIIIIVDVSVCFHFFLTKIKPRINEIIYYNAHKFDRRHSIIITPSKLISSF